MCIECAGLSVHDRHSIRLYSDINEYWQIIAGQTTESFKRYPNSSYVRLSFSLIYSSKEGTPRTLDLTANDDQSFELWFCGLQVCLAKQSRL